MHRLELQLERAAWRLSVTEFLLLSAGVGLVGALLTSLSSRALAIFGVLLGIVVPILVLSSAVRRRRSQFVKQLVEALPLIANALKAGVSLYQALDRAAEQMPKPISAELQRVLRDIRVGATPEDAFTALNERMKSRDLDLVVSAILVQRITGGNLAEILDSVAHTMRERVRIRG
jgi:tight adherence protein B